MFMDIEEFVILPIAAGVMICTEAIKKAFFRDENLRDRWVPLIALALGVFFNTWYNQWSFDYVIFLNGLASGLAAVGAFSTAKKVFSSTESEEDGVGFDDECLDGETLTEEEKEEEID